MSVTLWFLIYSFFLIQPFTIQGQDHGWGQSTCTKSQSESDFISTHIPLVPGQLPTTLQGYRFFKIWPSKSKVIGQVHLVGPTSYWLTFLLFYFNPWNKAFSKFDLEISRSSSWERSQLKACPTSYWFSSLSFHVNWPSYSCDTTLQNLSLKIQGQDHKPVMV